MNKFIKITFEDTMWEEGYTVILNTSNILVMELQHSGDAFITYRDNNEGSVEYISKRVKRRQFNLICKKLEVM